jgi:hypothetical protein
MHPENRNPSALVLERGAEENGPSGLGIQALVKKLWVNCGVRLQALLLGILVCVACGTQGRINDICGCLALEPDAADYRHNAKHVAIPSGTPLEIDVATILSWPQDIALPIDQPRTGRELQLVHISQAFLENASVNPGDCDIHMEISQVASKTAPRVVIETPIDSESVQPGELCNLNSNSMASNLIFSMEAICLSPCRSVCLAFLLKTSNTGAAVPRCLRSGRFIQQSLPFFKLAPSLGSYFHDSSAHGGTQRPL